MILRMTVRSLFPGSRPERINVCTSGLSSQWTLGGGTEGVKSPDISATGGEGATGSQSQTPLEAARTLLLETLHFPSQVFFMHLAPPVSGILALKELCCHLWPELATRVCLLCRNGNGLCVSSLCVQVLVVKCWFWRWLGHKGVAFISRQPLHHESRSKKAGSSHGLNLPARWFWTSNFKKPLKLW